MPSLSSAKVGNKKIKYLLANEIHFSKINFKH